jgi:hypothetical protein
MELNITLVTLKGIKDFADTSIAILAVALHISP